MSLHADWKSASPGAYAPGVGLRRRKRTPSRSAQAFTPIEIGLLRHLCARRRPPPTQRAFSGRRRPSRRLKSASPGAYAPSVGLRRRKRRTFGRRRPTVGRRPPEVEFIRRPRPSRRLEIDLPRRLRARRRPPPTQESALSVGAGRPSAEGLWRPNSFGTPRARRRPPPTQRALFRSAQADRWPKAPQGRIHSTAQADRRPKASGGRIHSARRPTLSGRPPQAEFIRRI
jgi:hypothetical protein